LPELRRRWRADAVGRFGAAVVDGLLALCRRAAAAIRAARPAPAGTGPGVVGGVDVELAAVDVAVVVYVHHGDFRRRHLLAEARRHLARELRGARAEAGLDERIVDAVIGTYCVDASSPAAGPPAAPARSRPLHRGLALAIPGRRRASPGGQRCGAERPRPGGGHQHPPPGPPARLQVRGQAGPAGPDGGCRQAIGCRPADCRGAVRATDFGDIQEQEFVVSPERLERLRELQRRAAELARAVPKAETEKQRGGTEGAPPHRPGYRPRR
jgi:hypothetical protein